MVARAMIVVRRPPMVEATKEMREDQVMQARYLIGQWQEIYEQT